jgi:ankyrin repeat protein
LPWLRFQADLIEIGMALSKIAPYNANIKLVNDASSFPFMNNTFGNDLSVGVSSSALAKIPDLLPTESEMRAMLPVSVIDIRGPALGEITTSILNYFNMIVYLISNKIIKISEDLFILLEIALHNRPFLTLLHGKTHTTRAFIQELFESAIYLQRTKVISILLDAELFFDAWSLIPQYPLLLAIEKREVALANQLVNAGADLTGNLGSGALTNAAEIGDLELVSFLTKMGADPNPEDTSRCNPPLFQAAEQGDIEMVELLLSCGADINVSCSDDPCPSPLVSAARNGDLQLVRLLLDRGVHTEDRGWRQATALALAADRGHSELARVLLNAGAETSSLPINPIPLSSENSSALYEAVKEGHQSVVQLLLNHKADPNTRAYHLGSLDTTGKTALFAAVSYNHEDITQLLLRSGAHVNEMNFYVTHESNHDSIDEEDRDDNKDYHVKCVKETALHQAVRKSNSCLVRMLLDAGASAICPLSDVKMQHGVKYRENFVYTTVNLVIENPSFEITRILFTADPNAALKYGTCFFHSAISSNDIELARFFLETGIDINQVPVGWSKGTALQQAASAGYSMLAQILLDYGAHVNAPAGGDHGRTALQSAAEKGNLKLVQVLLEYGADIHAPGTMKHGTALQLAAQAGHIQVTKQLLRFIESLDLQAITSSGYPDFNTVSYDWRSSMLPAAAKGGLIEVVESLLVEGADVDIVPPGTLYATALQEAVSQQDLKMVHLLLGYCADPNIPGPVYVSQRRRWRTGTALQTAVDRGNLELAYILMQAGARPDILSSEHENRRTPLEAAIANEFPLEQRIMLVQSLLAAGADVNLAGIYRNNAKRQSTSIIIEETALFAAVMMLDAQLVQILLKAGANVNAVSSCENKGEGYIYQISPLQMAVVYSDLGISRFLLGAGADVEIDCLFSYSPGFGLEPIQKAPMLAQAILNNNMELSQLLLDSGIRIDATSPTEESITALQAAAMGGHISIVETLLRRGAEVDRDSHFRWGTALESAAINGHAGIAFALLEAGADPTLGPPDRKGSALVAAARNDRIDIVQMFLNAIKARGISGQVYMNVLEEALDMALEENDGECNIAMGMIKTEIEDSKNA